MSSYKLVIARVTIPGSAVQQSLALQPEAGGAANPSERNNASETERRREEARELSLEAARSLLYSEVLKLQTNEGPIEGLVSRDEALGRRLQSMIRELEPADVRFGANGTCETTLVLPRSRLDAELPQ
jgi:hypothetical protein